MRIGHLTDLHVLEADPNRRGKADRVRLELLCNLRPVDPDDRRRRLLAALTDARAARVDHLVITGDLTEDGHPEQFESLAEILADAGVDPSRVTLVPGNHDAYGDLSAYDRALEGPLARYAATSRTSAPLDLGEAVIVPVCTRIAQPFVRAAGTVSSESLEGLRRVVADPAFRDRPLLVAIHHPLVERGPLAVRWFDGLTNVQEVVRALAPHRDVRVLHGHWHQHVDLPLPGGARVRAFGAPAVADHGRPLRVFDATSDGFRPRAPAARTARTLAP